MRFKTMFLATTLAAIPAGAAIAQPAAAPAPDAATATAQPNAAATTPNAATATPNAATTTPNATTTTTAEPNAAATTGQQGAGAPAVATSLATPADLKAGATVFDSTGVTLGTIESVTANGAVIAAGDLRAEVPAASFAKNDQGLVLGITKAEFEAAVNRAQS